MMDDGGVFGLGIWSKEFGVKGLEGKYWRGGGGVGMVGGLCLLVKGLINEEGGLVAVWNGYLG